ncbi:hypothetical protein CLV58_10613 [Spirosoma oryzae]|uniref:Ferric uptake regulator family protein n=1 Tax=Spirosoma oryzae TaxID=1469603 RepID=A0A2T0T579_9BACT|nr:hypothetical protein [Spirosoma oryzae]PRY40830.1 hypothetical protein CLV58_10613 [Spirosoma oryzae]
MIGTHYNTNGVSGEQKAAATARSQSQAEKVLQLFADNPSVKRATPSQIYNGMVKHQLITHHVPITSIRRAISDLVKGGMMVKLPETKPGPMKQPEHFYSLKQAA